jgi:NADPH:quinone reductase-like Zn-dependent oxidoreductase
MTLSVCHERFFDSPGRQRAMVMKGSLMSPRMMRAAQFDRFGPPEVLYVAERPVPEVKPGYVLVEVHATTVQGGEMMSRAGRLTLLTGRNLPRTIGIDFTGRVAAVADPRSDLHVGDPVWGCLPREQYIWGRFGAASEFVSVPRERVSPAPRDLDLGAAATLLIGTVADRGLRREARLRPGERLLVRGATGGVGILAVQLGKAFGAHVTALAGARHAGLLRELGADEVIDYRTTSLRELPRYDVVFDTVGSEMAELRRHLGKGGRMVGIAMDPDHLLRSALFIAASAVFGSRRVRFFSGNPRGAELVELAAYAEKGLIRPIVDSVYPLDDIASAHRDHERGGVVGKRVILVSGRDSGQFTLAGRAASAARRDGAEPEPG